MYGIAMFGEVPTAKQQLDDFNADALNCAAIAIEREIATGLRPELIGKSLGNVVVGFYATLHHPSDNEIQQVRSLNVTPFDQSTVHEMALSGVFNDTADVYQRYLSTAKEISKAKLTDSMIADTLLETTWGIADFYEELPQNLDTDDSSYVVAEYVEPLRRSCSGVINNYAAKPVIDSAKEFVDSTMQYVFGNDFERQYVRTTSPVIRSHGYTFKMSPDLEINGFESLGFLRAYGMHMQILIMEANHAIESCRTNKDLISSEAIASYESVIEQCQIALSRVSKYFYAAQ